MTDSPQSSANSYVNDYQPPQPSAVAAQNPAVAPAPQTDDPLAALEELLKKYEQKEEQGTEQNIATPPQSAAPSQKANNPLDELERLLKDYETRKEYEKKRVVEKKQEDAVEYSSQTQNSQPSTQAVSEFKDALRMSQPSVAKPASPAKPTSQPSEETKKALQALEDALEQYEQRKSSPAPAAKTDSSVASNDFEPIEASEESQDESASTPSESAPTPGKKQVYDPLDELEALLKEMKAEQETPPKSPAPKTEAVGKTITSEELQNIMNPDVAKSDISAPVPDSDKQSTQQPSQSDPSTSIEDQNIFFLLGVESATDQEKEAFLDELQEAIWEDFLEKDLELLVTQEELQEIRTLRENVGNDSEKQEALISKVESYVPDVEEIMLEKALELKEEMVWERVAGMKEYYAGRVEAMNKIEEAEKHLKQGHWEMGVKILNGLTP